jgi:hypothetical protein
MSKVLWDITMSLDGFIAQFPWEVSECRDADLIPTRMTTRLRFQEA